MTDADDFLSGPLEKLIVCPVCDAAYQLQRPKHGEQAVCSRCHTVLIQPRRKAGMQIIAVSIAVVILIVFASVFPFLRISAAGRSNAVSILDAALSFTHGPMMVLALLTAGFIIFVPLTRMLLTLYVLVPVVLDKPPARYAIRAFRLSEAMRPWSMAEIFALGCAVALVKVADLATVSFGPAFWMFGVLVVLVIAQDGYMCKWSVWNSLEHPKRR
ncbi:paraquat-inducible protein A [Sulfitobacter donghicola]|uniref:Paraquat-inducible protein A n=1 Tax=Sulfitobacter donghicola DSW-25 = KCTC 12864 = JCM 14565 TaxID=1300350 RepID=A0A073IKH3_9RHOB|nr:paraquat-inducible protein A [Sulfitobacter donghicola]KEJ90838.1 paraquat-inducible protein A [Sulfitobacter donghicola DSW-25 = KCTC 12864 = JCM 14565]KIN68115.1 Paraquat-inducible protein A [Sulfitobacter donghicola DSW-25 = KCTC 12864 = JCM 14565]